MQRDREVAGGLIVTSVLSRLEDVVRGSFCTHVYGADGIGKMSLAVLLAERRRARGLFSVILMPRNVCEKVTAHDLYRQQSYRQFRDLISMFLPETSRLSRNELVSGLRGKSLFVILPEPRFSFLEDLFSLLDRDTSRIITVCETVPSWTQKLPTRLFEMSRLESRDGLRMLLACGDMV